MTRGKRKINTTWVMKDFSANFPEMKALIGLRGGLTSGKEIRAIIICNWAVNLCKLLSMVVNYSASSDTGAQLCNGGCMGAKC